MVDTSFQIHTKNQGTIVARHTDSNPYKLTRGDTITLNLWLPDSEDDLLVSSNTTIEDGAVYGSVTIEPGATLSVPIGGTLYAGTITNNGTIDNDGTIVINDGITNGWEDMREYGDYAGSYTTIEKLNGDYNYREFIPSAASVDSLLIGVEPSSDLKNKDLNGVWGLVDSVSDTRNTALNIDSYEYTIRILAEYSEYADHPTAETNLKV